MVIATMPDYVSVREAAELLDYHPESVRRLIRNGKLEAEQKSNAWWIFRDSVEAYREALRSKPKRGRPKA
jgi:excisionase family DNA binding protein